MSYANIAEATGFLRSVKKDLLASDLLVARIAAQLSREDRFLPIDRVASDAVKAADLVRVVRVAKPGKRRTSAFARLRYVCAAYGAHVVMRETAAGVSLNLQLPEGRFATRAGTLFPLL